MLDFLIIAYYYVKLQIVESVGAESLELARYRAKMEDRARQEEELFMRAPITKKEKQREKHLKKSRNGYAHLKINLWYYSQLCQIYLGRICCWLTVLNLYISGCLV